MHIKPVISPIGRFSYLKTIFFGKGYRIAYITNAGYNTASALGDLSGYDEQRGLLDRSDRGLLSISKHFIILTYLKSDGKRYPLFVKRCEFVLTKIRTRHFVHCCVRTLEAPYLRIFKNYKDPFADSESKNLKYNDEDGWNWDFLIWNITSSKRSTFGTGTVFVTNEKGEDLYHIRLI